MNDSRIGAYLADLYGASVGAETHTALRLLLARYRRRPTALAAARLPLSERDALLITYGDQVYRTGETPLHTLAEFCGRYLQGLISGVHILPFYPATSDDGFSVVDYLAVDPALGTWNDVARLGEHFRLMFDAVINHMSASSVWFQGFLRDESQYQDYFITVDEQVDLSQVVRPRALPLLTPFETAAGVKNVWTTFSADQIDLNYANPRVLLEVLETLLAYAARGADFIRLDAIGYLWKEVGTTCLHLPQAHWVIQLIRAMLDEAAPDVMLITETNVPHVDNIAYFGDGANEAQLVYNFALPPVVLHSLYSGSAAVLSAWAASLTLPSRRTTFFNFLASHDGIGINPARGILPAADIEALVHGVVERGGLVSYKHNADGSQSPYELNVNFLDALAGLDPAEAPVLQLERFMAAQAIMLALVGVPGIYFHSLFGSRGWPAGVAQTGRNRTINREKLPVDRLTQALADPSHRRAQIFGRFAQLLAARAASPAFDPLGDQQVLEVGEGVFALLRRAPAPGAWALCLHNVAGAPQTLELRLSDWGPPAAEMPLFDLVTRRPLLVDTGRGAALTLAPYQVVWAAPITPHRGGV